MTPPPSAVLEPPAREQQQPAGERSPEPSPALAHRDGRPGFGRIELTRVGGRTVVTRSRANSPLKLLAPRSGARGRAAWVFSSTYGGGLVAGDDVRVELRAGDGTAALLGTQASTKVYPAGAGGVGCRQALDATIGDGGVLVVARPADLLRRGAVRPAAAVRPGRRRVARPGRLAHQRPAGTRRAVGVRPVRVAERRVLRRPARLPRRPAARPGRRTARRPAPHGPVRLPGHGARHR